MAKSKILMVDDERDLLDTNKEFFEQDDFVVSIAESGFDAIRLISEEKFDAIITDYTMPVMNGIQFASYVKVNELNALTPIFVISGNINDKAIERLKKIGVIGFISKPYDIMKFINIVKSKILKNSRTDSYSDEVISLFSSSVSEVFSHYFPNKVKIVDSKIFNTKTPLAHYASVIPIYGQHVYGYNAVYCNSDVLQMICHTLFGQKNTQFSDNFLTDLTGEINNNIVGNLKLQLAKQEEVIQLGLPVSVKAHPQALTLMPSSPKHLITLSIDNTPCYVEFSLGDPLRVAALEKKQHIRIFS